MYAHRGTDGRHKESRAVEQGFTLLEPLITMTIIAVLVVAISFSLGSFSSCPG